MPQRKRSRAPEQPPVQVQHVNKAPRLDGKAQIIQSVAADWESSEAKKVKSVARVLGSDVRYMRRKKREYIQEVLKAHEALEQVQVRVIAESGEEKATSPAKEMAEHKEEEEDSLEYESAIEKAEREMQEEQQSSGPEVTTDNPVEPIAEPDKDQAREGDPIAYIRAIEKAQQQDSNVPGSRTAEEQEEAVEEPSVEPEEKSVLPEPMSPARASVYSPVETVGQKASAIDPTPEKSAPPVALVSKHKKNVSRGIAQSSSSASTRKRMISFSPERAPRPENRALALKKLEKNLKTNEKLQQRLKAPTPVKASAPSRMSSPAVATQARRPIHFTSPQARRPMSFTSPQARRHMNFNTPPPPRRPVYQSPYTAASCSLPLSQTEELEYDPTQEDPEKEHDTPVVEVAPNEAVFKPSVVVEEDAVATGDRDDVHSEQEDGEDAVTHSQDDVALSQESTASHADKLAPLSQQSCDSMASAADADASAHAQADGAFTSTSVIGDVGLFNCDTDVEYTGGVYGEGTDGKVTAAVINGQKVALKRAKPHEGFPEHEAKHRAALELHYLRRVRHMKGFLQCLGLCDAIEHTCIALEVMDCKLSDYLRRYGVNSGGSKHRRYTLSFDDTKTMLKQICLPMMTLHEDVNVAHGDLACRNILLRTPPEGYEQSWEPDIKLSDFGRIKLPADEPKILDSSFSFHKNCDVGAFGREILYRLLVGEIVPKEYVETRSLHKLLQDVTVTQVPDAAKARLGPYYNLFMRCTGWGVRPTFREIYEHLDDLLHFETTENGLFPLKPSGSDASFMSPVADGRYKTPTSSASRAHKRDTPTKHGHRPAGPKSRLFSSKSFADAGVQGPKPVNWLKTRSVGVQRSVAQQASTPTTARPMLLKKKRKTPPSAGAGASRRSLQILNQIQHRTSEKGRKST
jgi:hypothetical protein